MAYGNHWRVRKYEGKELREVLSDVTVEEAVQWRSMWRRKQ